MYRHRWFRINSETEFDRVIAFAYAVAPEIFHPVDLSEPVPPPTPTTSSAPSIEDID